MGKSGNTGAKGNTGGGTTVIIKQSIFKDKYATLSGMAYLILSILPSEARDAP